MLLSPGEYLYISVTLSLGLDSSMLHWWQVYNFYILIKWFIIGFDVGIVVYMLKS